MQEHPLIAQFREYIRSQKENEPVQNAFHTGLLRCSGAGTKSYEFTIGWNPFKADECDDKWQSFNIRLIEYIEGSNFNEDQLNEFNTSIQMDDSHWNWLGKIKLYQTDEYKWFFLNVDGEPQAVCLIYHPKDSKLGLGKIFYVEYLAVAPWNRDNPLERRYLGVGTQMLREVVAYCRDQLGLYPSFSLHALKRAEGYYNRIGMIKMHEFDKPGLSFYEMPADKAAVLLGV